MALNRSPELNQSAIVQIVCLVMFHFESALALTNIISSNTCHVKFHTGSILDPGDTI